MDSSEERHCDQWCGKHRAACSVKILKENIYKMFEFLSTSPPSVQCSSMWHSQCVIQGKGQKYIMTTASMFASGSTLLGLPSDWALNSVLCHLSSKGEPQNGKQKGNTILCHIVHDSQTGVTHIWLTCQS